MSEAKAAPAAATQPQRLYEVAALFLKLGIIGFGGPAAHIALMRQEVVARRKWVTDQQFLDLLGATNLIPGPNSTEMTMHLGYLRAGWRGLIVGGTLFILPAMMIVLGFAWAYVEYGSNPEVGWLLYGIKPVIIAIIAQALWGLLGSAMKTPFLATVGIAVLVLYFLGANEIALMFGAGAIVMLVSNLRRLQKSGDAMSILSIAGLASPVALQTASAGSVSLLTLFLTFLKIGSVIYGSGYVLLAFLRNDLVVRLGWLTDQQLLDAIAVGQVTPGPVFTTATFIGYILADLPGAILATVGIFLPSFIFVAAVNPLVPKLRRSSWMAGLLDGVNVAAFGLMAAVTWTLARDAIVDWFTIFTGVAAALLLVRFKVNSAWLVLMGAVLGLLYRFIIE
jgi:chromate transporter